MTKSAEHSATVAMLVAAGVGVQVGAATVASRFALLETEPFALGAMRYAIGVLCLLPLVLRGPRIAFAPRDLAPMAVLGILQFGVLIALLNIGLLYIPAGRAAVVFAVFPLLTMVFAAGLGREALTARKSIGVLLTMAGVAIALNDTAFAPGKVATPWVGEAAVFLAAACGAICSVLYRPYLQRYPTLQVSAFAMLASVVFLVPFAAWRGLFDGWPAFAAGTWAAIVFVGLSSGIAYFGLLWALSKTTPTRVTVFQALAPITAAALGFLLLGESLSASFIAGLCLVVAGLWVALGAS
jgi:drug/metabolite transporter (DMT)-like permease